MTTDTLNAFELARMADCRSPNSNSTPGANFLYQIAEAVKEAKEYGWLNEDTSWEVADNAVPVYTHKRWEVFVDLCAYEEDVTELSSSTDMTEQAGIALYMIAERLVHALMQEDDDANK